MSDKRDVDNDGYYQDVDEARYCDVEHVSVFSQIGVKRETKPRNEASYKDTHYEVIDRKYNSLSRNGRRKFCEERRKYHAEREKKFREDQENGTYKNLPASQVFCKCKNCGGGFIAKKADRKRGWAKFCSKSCKAQF